MLSKPINSTQLSFLQPGLKEQLAAKHPLYILADQINWQLFEEKILNVSCLSFKPSIRQHSEGKVTTYSEAKYTTLLRKQFCKGLSLFLITA